MVETGQRQAHTHFGVHVMVQYIVSIAQTILNGCDSRQNLGELFKLLPALAEELDRLDPRDFLPAAQYDFVLAKVEARNWANRKSIMGGTDAPLISAMAKRVIEALSQYGGDGSRAVVRSFGFVKDAGLRQIIERDYRELKLNVYPSGGWKSTVILAGSILEALLFDQLTTDPTTKAKAVASKRAPKDKSGSVKDLAAGDWKLIELIDVAVDMGFCRQTARSHLTKCCATIVTLCIPKRRSVPNINARKQRR